ncbi:MAG: hypothetical protein G01um101416_924 [Microgenomates group bacterium Gr01-1014_16]|nr:MAG: hypothetical protein G01um101416_924 [Microgenomates group bacterium Gr01-1014_16]
MNQVSVSQARQDFLQLANRVYAGEEFLVVKNGIQMLEMRPVRKEKRVIKKRILPGATKLMSHLKGTTLEVADRLRKEALYGRYDSR